MSQKSAGAWIKPVVPAAGTVMFAALVGLAAPAAMAAGAEQLTYRVTHAVFGDIGTYSNTVEPRGEATTVKTQSHLNVTLLGANVFHEEAQRVEQWQGDRLVSFRGVTSRKGGSTEVTGEARGNSFVITSPKGTVTAPASVRPANPWSDNFISANMMMRPDNGRVEPVSVSGGATSSVKLHDFHNSGSPLRHQRRHQIQRVAGHARRPRAVHDRGRHRHRDLHADPLHELRDHRLGGDAEAIAFRAAHPGPAGARARVRGRGAVF